MANFVIIEVAPDEGDYTTIPHYEIFVREHFAEIGILEEARPIALVSRNGDKWEYFDGDRDIEADIPNGSAPASSADELLAVSHVARTFLDPTAIYYTPRVILQQV
jgi:hypothetical protein